MTCWIYRSVVSRQVFSPWARRSLESGHRPARPTHPSVGRAGHREIDAPKVTTLVIVLDVLVALVIVGMVIGGDAYLNYGAHRAPPPGDHTSPDTPGT